MGLFSLFDGFTSNKKARIVAFGSSVVERSILGTHWFDYIELALSNKTGRIHQCLNCGNSGDTTRDLLLRFETDVAYFRPNITFIKIGGNDTELLHGINYKEFKTNLLMLIKKLEAVGSEIVFITYHIPILRLYGANKTKKLYGFMDIIRETAYHSNCYLIDNMLFWETLHQLYPEIHKSLIDDEIHLNELGNLFLGMTIAKELNLSLKNNSNRTWKKANCIVKLVAAVKEQTQLDP